MSKRFDIFVQSSQMIVLVVPNAEVHVGIIIRSHGFEIVQAVEYRETQLIS